VKELAARRDVMASFMPKPPAGVQGSGMHLHVSLFSGGTNAFFGADDPYHLSPIAHRFIAGLLRHAREITAVTNQWVNSYKRLIVGYEAPVYISWARNNRSALVRVPPTKAGKPDSTRVEYRAADPACNPYLALAAVLSAGLAGVEGDYELPAELATNLYDLSSDERRSLGIGALPSSLADAVDEAEASKLLADTLGEHVFEWFVRNKRAEWVAYRSEVTPFELRRYLPTL
jgi:glutamine synthetase